MNEENDICVEVVFATPQCQEIVTLNVPVGTKLIEAIDASGLQASFPEYEFTAMSKGIWGELRGDDYVLKNGDRVEIYRPLSRDPKEARRQRARRTSE
jgi:putative ubiquitin-RnfH superfamily antitoxin RatB of RatAB toxin-antitoxin module